MLLILVGLSCLVAHVSAQRNRFGNTPVLAGRQNSNAQDECPQDQISFEMITGYVYTAPADMLDSQPGTLMLTDCIDTCRANASCRSINYETGLCVLFASSADENQGNFKY